MAKASIIIITKRNKINMKRQVEEKRWRIRLVGTLNESNRHQIFTFKCSIAVSCYLIQLKLKAYSLFWCALNCKDDNDQ